MSRRRKLRFVGAAAVVFGIAAAIIVGIVTRELWNRLMPAIFGLPAIGLWQTLGLLLLGRLLFGGFGRGWRKRRFVRGWKDLTPEERDRFRRAMDDRCRGNWGERKPEENPNL
jgi:hypothetical protein